jgi:hypothetical protein
MSPATEIIAIVEKQEVGRAMPPLLPPRHFHTAKTTDDLAVREARRMNRGSRRFQSGGLVFQSAFFDFNRNAKEKPQPGSGGTGGFPYSRRK